MIVSPRSPKLVRSPNAPAYGESGSTQLPLSEPVSKKFLDARSPSVRFQLSDGVISASVLGWPFGSRLSETTCRAFKRLFAHNMPTPATSSEKTTAMLRVSTQ